MSDDGFIAGMGMKQAPPLGTPGHPDKSPAGKGPTRSPQPPSDADLLQIGIDASTMTAEEKAAAEAAALNESLRLATMNRGAHWVDFWDVQHRDDGTLRDELFIADRLHLNNEGYEVWVRELRRLLPWLDPAQP